jgi:signal transduction histidine kinase
VGNVLTQPQVEAGQLSLQHAVFSPSVIIGNVLQACRLAARVCAIEWEHLPEEDALPELVEGDRDRIAQVVQNLITNATRFSEGRPVRVRATLAAEGGEPWLAVRVSDTGRGMTAHEVAMCFDSGQAAPAAAGGGSGLGLYSACTMHDQRTNVATCHRSH